MNAFVASPSDVLRDVAPLITAGAVIVSSAVFWWYTNLRGGTVLERKRLQLQIGEIEELSSDTKRIRLNFPRKGMTLGLPVGKHLKVYGPNPTKEGQKTWNGRPDDEVGRNEIERQYTPVTGDEVRGYVDLVVKMYRPGKITMPDGRDVNWADGGKMSGTVMDTKNVGDFLEINGPFGLVEYKGRGKFKLPGVSGLQTFHHVAMMAGGSGLTPMLQILQAAVRDPGDKTKFSLIYANKTEGDILCRRELLDLEAQSGGYIKLDFTLDFPPKEWKYSTGFISEAMIKKDLPAKELNPVVLLCGPPPMVEFACKKNLFAMGYTKESVVCF